MPFTAGPNAGIAIWIESAMPWSPERYRQFQAERFAPFEDLIKLIRVREGMRVIDLGCGTGELTRRLADHLPQSDVLGIDNSPQMLAEAQKINRTGLRFELRAIEEVAGEWDLIFSHAAIQWVENHPVLIPRLMSLVQPGGQLAMQFPANHRHPSQAFVLELASEEPFRSALKGWSRARAVLEPDAYAEFLYSSGGRGITLFEKVYLHELDDADAVADWMTGTALVPYLDRFDDEMKKKFMDAYRQKLRRRWPQSPVLFAFRRILFCATRRLEKQKQFH